MIYSRVILPLLPLLALATPNISEPDYFTAETSGLDLARSDDGPTLDELHGLFPDKIFEDNFDGTLEVRDRTLSEKPSSTSRTVKALAIRGAAGTLAATGYYVFALGRGQINDVINTCMRAEGVTLQGQINQAQCHNNYVATVLGHLMAFGFGAWGGQSTFGLLWNKITEMAQLPTEPEEGGDEESGPHEDKRDWIGSSSLLATRAPKSCSPKKVNTGYIFKKGALIIAGKQFCKKYNPKEVPLAHLVDIVEQMTPTLIKENAGAEFVLHHNSGQRLGTFQIRGSKDSEPEPSKICSAKFTQKLANAGQCPK